MAGLPDILSAYRQGLASERDVRTSEMQMALSQLQYESERDFREEGRRREDAFRGLTLANQSMKESVSKDASSIYSLMSGLDFMNRDSDGKIGNFKEKKATALGFSKEEARQIYNMVLMYESESPVLQQQAQNAAVNIGRLVSAYKDSWVSSGNQPDFLKALSNSGILYAGEEVDGEVMYDETKFDLSFEPFTNVSKATDVLANISDELGEMARGDYEIQRGINIDRKFLKEQSYDDVVNRAANLVESSLGSLDTDLGDDDISSSIADTRGLLTSVKSKIEQGFEGFDDELVSLNKKLKSLKSLQQSKISQDKVNAVSNLANDILLNAGADMTKKNIKVATDQALNLLGAEAGALTSQPPFSPESISGLEDYDYFSGQIRQLGDPNIPYE